MSAYHFLASSFVGTRLEFSTAASFWLLRYIPLLYAFLHTSNGFPHIDLSLSDGKTLLSPHTLGKVCDHHSSTLFFPYFIWSQFKIYMFFLLFWQNITKNCHFRQFSHFIFSSFLNIVYLKSFNFQTEKLFYCLTILAKSVTTPLPFFPYFFITVFILAKLYLYLLLISKRISWLLQKWGIIQIVKNC